MKLYPHQKRALDMTKGMRRVAYYLDMGLGKTYVGSEKMMEIHNRVNLLICQKSKVKDWFNHFRMHYPDMIVVDYTISENRCLTSEDIVLFSDKRPVVVIVNYELAWRRQELAKLTEYTLILDESSLIQNPNAKQTKWIIKRAKCNACILLSGTPCGGKFENLWTQSYLLGCGLKKKEFDERFVNFETIRGGGAFPIRIVDRKNPYKNKDGLKAMLREHGAVFMKTEEVFDLPEQRMVDVFSQVPASYRRFLKDRVIEVDGKEFVGNTTLSFRLALRELASGYSKEKLAAFRDLAESTSDRLIVFYNFNKELEELVRIVCSMDRPISVINGKAKDLTAYENDENSVTFCQYQAGSMGHNLQKANKMIFFSLPERSELFEQAKKRIHRIGQNMTCTYYVMQTASSIDQLIYRALEEKKDYTDELFRNDFL
ncbi:MAG: SNF2-related protein [Bullifex sp.]